MTELFHGTVHTLKWDFHLSHAVPIHLFAAFLHMPPNNILPARRDTGFIQSEHVALYSHASPALLGLLSAPSHVKSFLFFNIYIYTSEGSSHILRLVQPNFSCLALVENSADEG